MLYRLKNAGYEAYLVGGGVRDVLLSREPKDFDVATNATPEEVKEQFRNCRLIGRRFRLVHVQFGRQVVEVATFRGSQGSGNGDDLEIVDGRIVRDNAYGTLEEDAWRRDFTVNALYYNIKDFSVVDYTGGMADLQAKVLRLIGDPVQRYREDPVRMLRAVRFAAKLGFGIHPDTQAPIFELGYLLQDIPPARLLDESFKLFMSGCAVSTFELLRHYGLFKYLFPETEASLAQAGNTLSLTFLLQALGNTDARLNENKPVTPAFLFAAFLWEPLRTLAQRYQSEGMGEFQAFQIAAPLLLTRQNQTIAIPKRFSLIMREIWSLQIRLQKVKSNKVMQYFSHPRFRAAYDFLLLRAQAGEEVRDEAEWWTRFQEMDEAQRATAIHALRNAKNGRPGRKPGRARKPRTDKIEISAKDEG